MAWYIGTYYTGYRIGSMAKILIIEDNEDVLDTISTYLTFEHYSVESLTSGTEAVQHLRTFPYDAVILDWDLPGMSGIEILKSARAAGLKTPILMLTGKDSLVQKEAGLDSGADDYLTKPFQVRELGARIRALLRRTSGATDNVLKAGDITLDPEKHRAYKSGQPVELTPAEFDILEFLMRNKNKVFSAEALLNRVWPSDSEATTEAFKSAMKRMRKKVDPDGTLIRTVHGVGVVLENV